MRNRLLLIVPFLLLPAACAPESSSAPPLVAAISVDAETVSVSAFTPHITLLGKVEAHETVPVLVPQTGVITYAERFASGLRTGVAVARGEALASIVNEGASIDLVEARLQARAAEQQLDRLQRGYDAGITTSAELSDAGIQAELARERLASATRSSSRLAIRAPRAGTLVVDEKWPAGTEVPANTAIASIAAGGAPRVVSRVSADQRRALDPGLTVDLIDPGTRRTIGRGLIEEIDSVIDRAGTAAVVISAPGGADDRIPGEGVIARVLLPRRESITVPEHAVVHSSEGSAVFIIDNDRARRRPVTLGARSSGRVEVLEGLQEGDQVVVTGASFLSEGVPVSTSTDGAPG